MTLHDDLERLATRGTPRGADAVYADALAAAHRPDVPEAPDAAGRRSPGRLGIALAGVAAIATLVAGIASVALDDSGGSTLRTSDDIDLAPVTTASTTTSTTTAPDPTVEPVEPVGGRLLVGTETDDRIGWIDPVDPIGEPWESVPPIPIYDENGRQIAWWGFTLGWIDFETMNDPDYDYDALWDEYWAFGLERYGGG